MTPVLDSSALLAFLLGEEGADLVEAALSDSSQCSGLSLADRLCLALADRDDQPVLTADAAWGTEGRVRQIR